MKKTQLERNEEALKDAQRTLRHLIKDTRVTKEKLYKLEKDTEVMENLIDRIKRRIENEQ